MIRSLLSSAGPLVLLFFLLGCTTPALNGITQVATIDALLAGVYDGHMSLETLRRYGDFGIGTFEGLDGEMILLEGTFYKVRVDGKVYQPTLSERTPFACVTRFVPDITEIIQTSTDMKSLEERIDRRIPQQNRFCAFTLHGYFPHVQARSVPSQTKPYPPLVEVTKKQTVFTLLQVHGTLIGFRSPPFVEGVNVPGYHVHFIADDHSGGGHVLDFEMTQGTLEADTVQQWLTVYLPTGSDSFEAADLTRDHTVELEKVEKSVSQGISDNQDVSKDR